MPNGDGFPALRGVDGLKALVKVRGYVRRRMAQFAMLMSLIIPSIHLCSGAALSWKELVLERTSDEGASSLEVTYRFRNTSQSPVRIVSVETSCGCTTATLKKADYSPGESGELNVVFNLVGRIGLQEKTITVVTSDAPGRGTILTLRVRIPALFEVSPRLLWWEVGEPAVGKQTKITINSSAEVTVNLLPPTDTKIIADLESAPGGHHFVLSIKPVSTSEKFLATVNLSIKADGSSSHVVAIYAEVR